MSRLLRELLGSSDPTLSLKLRSFEQSIGGKKVDVELTAEIVQRTTSKIKAIGLLPSRTSDEDLFQEVVERAAVLDAFLRKKYLHNSKLVTEFIRHHQTEVPVLKKAVLRRLIKENPPKTVMKALGYTSCDSMLKRAAIDQIVIGIFAIESVTWHRRFLKTIKKLQHKDFELKTLAAVPLEDKLAEAIRKKTPRQFVYAIPLGVVGVFCPERERALYVAATTHHALEALHRQMLFLKLRYYSTEFVALFASSLYRPVGVVLKVNSHAFNWDEVFEALMNSPTLIQNLEAPLHGADFTARLRSDMLSGSSEAARFFVGSELLGTKNVSFHINDVAFILQHALPLYSTAYVYRRDAIKRTLRARFLIAAFPEKLEEFISTTNDTAL